MSTIGGKKRGQLLAYGRSKEKCSDYWLVTLALTIDSGGFPQTAQLYPGNISEPNTFRETVEALNMDPGHHHGQRYFESKKQRLLGPVTIALGDGGSSKTQVHAPRAL